MSYIWKISNQTTRAALCEAGDVFTFKVNTSWILQELESRISIIYQTTRDR
jgi:hypothetical protein